MTIADLNSILASFALITGVGLALAQQILARLTTRRISKRVGARSDQGLGESVADADTPPPLVPEYHKARAEVVISAGLLLLWRADIPFKAQLPVLSIQVSESTIPPLVAIVLSYGVCRLVMDAIGVPAPHVMAWATILTEVIGGLAVILGAFVCAARLTDGCAFGGGDLYRTSALRVQFHQALVSDSGRRAVRAAGL